MIGVNMQQPKKITRAEKVDILYEKVNKLFREKDEFKAKEQEPVVVDMSKIDEVLEEVKKPLPQPDNSIAERILSEISFLRKDSEKLQDKYEELKWAVASQDKTIELEAEIKRLREVNYEQASNISEDKKTLREAEKDLSVCMEFVRYKLNKIEILNKELSDKQKIIDGLEKTLQETRDRLFATQNKVTEPILEEKKGFWSKIFN